MMRVLLKAQFNRISGYGNDAMDIAINLERLGVDVYPWPTSIVPGMEREFTDLLTKTPRKGEGAYDVTLQFMPPFDIRVSDRFLQIANPGLPKKIAKVHVGYSMWEKDKLTRADMRGHSIGQSPWKHLDWMYVTTRMNVAAFQNYEDRIEYRVLPCGIEPDHWPFELRETTGPTKFVMIGELHKRKNPYVAIQAFNELKHEKGSAFDAELHLKTTVAGIPKDLGGVIDGLFVHDKLWPRQQLLEWMMQMHCYLAPSRGEGNLKPPMEFMATGGTVIAVKWSGPENWLTPESGYEIKYKLVHMDKNDPESPRDASADKEDLKRQMWHVHTHREEARAKGRYAAKWIRESMGWERLIKKMVRDFDQAVWSA